VKVPRRYDAQRPQVPDLAHDLGSPQVSSNTSCNIASASTLRTIYQLTAEIASRKDDIQSNFQPSGIVQSFGMSWKFQTTFPDRIAPVIVAANVHIANGHGFFVGGFKKLSSHVSKFLQ
jgi:deoxyxylulose-5-phosphate synthase